VEDLEHAGARSPAVSTSTHSSALAAASNTLLPIVSSIQKLQIRDNVHLILRGER
jgi:hypothetical protein